MDPLVSLDKLAEVAGPFEDNDPKPSQALDMASAYIRAEAGEDFTQDTQDVTLRGNWSPELHLPRPPIVGVTTVEVRYAGDPAYTTIAAGSFTWDPFGLVYMPGGYWGGDRGVVHVVYPRGWDEVPEDIQTVTLTVAKRLLLFSDRYSDLQVRDSGAGVSVGLSELEARIVRRYKSARVA